MSDPLKDAMTRAVDRIAPFPPDAEALKKAAKRSQMRRRIVGGYLGLMLAGSLGAWAVSTINDTPDTDRNNRQRVAAPASWDRLAVSGRVQLPGEPTSITALGDDVWVGLLDGRLLLVDTRSNEAIVKVDVGSSITDLAADDGAVWIAGTKEGSEPVQGFSGYHANTIFKLDLDAGELSEVADIAPTHARMVAENGNLFFLGGAVDQETGEVDLLTQEGQIRNTGFSALSLTAADGSVWAAMYDEAVELDADTGDMLNLVSVTPSGSRVSGSCSDCPPPIGTIAANQDYVVQIPAESQSFVVLDRSGRLHHRLDFKDPRTVIVDDAYAFVSQGNESLALVDLVTGEITSETDLGVTPGPMAVSNGSVWIADWDGKKLVEVSDLGPAPVASESPTSDGEEDRTSDLPGTSFGPPQRTFYKNEELRFLVSYPDDWIRADEAMTKLSNPREILTLGTMSMSIDDGELGDCAPTEPLSRLGPDDALIFVTEREIWRRCCGGPYIPPKPIELGLDDLRLWDSDCWSRKVYGAAFRDDDRTVLVEVALGDDPSPERRQQVSDILSSLRFGPLDQR